MSSAALQRAQAALVRRDFATARREAEVILLERPADAGANQILGFVALEEGDASNALRFLQRADKSAPGQPSTLNALGIAYRRTGAIAEARRAFTRAGERGLIEGWRNLGSLEAQGGDSDAAAAAYRRALAINAQDSASHAGLAQALELLHHLESARSHAERALVSDPQDEIAALTLANVELRAANLDQAEALASAVARRSRSLTNQALAWGVIGDARDKAGDAREAFAAFAESNRLLLAIHGALLQHAHLPYHPEGVDRSASFVATTDFSVWSSEPAEPAPIFLVGFPRSGTTLLEQVLSSHPRLVCIEEREHLALAAQSAAADPSELISLTRDRVEAIRIDYWRRVKAEKPVGARIVVDKLPLNIVFLPLIRRVFPNAKILFALRDPRDVVLSCYQQRFGMNAAMVQFLRLETAASYYDKVMAFGLLCRDRLGLEIQEIRYEDVVANLEGVARDVTRFLGLDFEASMLSPHEAARHRAINTPSSRQVVQPIYANSVARWRRYQEQLAPALPTLNAWARRLGYDA